MKIRYAPHHRRFATQTEVACSAFTQYPDIEKWILERLLYASLCAAET